MLFLSTKMYKLRKISACNTSIKEIPENIGDLTELRVLELKITMVSKLPESITKLQVSYSYIVITHHKHKPNIVITFHRGGFYCSF